MKNFHHRFRGFLSLAVMLGLVLGIAAAEDTPKKVSKAEGLNAVTSKVPPEYPAMAKQLKIEGAVELEVLVSETGAVEKVNIVSGNPVLTRPASDAIRKWKFAPFSAEGKIVKALVPVSMTFKM
ncbi:MAG: energy transducer TonB [Candidatus Solibacter sp.]